MALSSQGLIRVFLSWSWSKMNLSTRLYSLFLFLLCFVFYLFACQGCHLDVPPFQTMLLAWYPWKQDHVSLLFGIRKLVSLFYISFFFLNVFILIGKLSMQWNSNLIMSLWISDATKSWSLIFSDIHFLLLRVHCVFGLNFTHLFYHFNGGWIFDLEISLWCMILSYIPL